MKKYGEMDPAERPLIVNALPELVYPRRLNAVRVLLESAVEKGWGERPAYFFEDQVITFSDVRTAVRRYAAAFRSLGIAPGDSVLIRIEDRPELVFAILGVQAIGGIAIPTYPQLRADELEYRADHAGAKLAVVSATLLDEAERLPDRCDTVEQMVVVPASEDARFLSLNAILEDPEASFEYADTDSDDVALLLYTSGSTGRSKGAMHSHADLLAVCDSYCRYCIGLTPDDVVGGPAAVPFALGYGFFALFPLRFGAAAILQPNKAPEQVVQSLIAHGATVISAVATYYQLLCQYIERGGVRLDRLRLAAVGGEPVPVHLEDRWRAATGLPLHEFLGTTELLHIFLSTRDGIDEPRKGAIGIAVPGYEVSVRDPATFEPVADGEPGLLCVRGATGTRYLNRPDAQREAVRDGWNIFQDIVWRDPDGYIHFVARHDDMIVSAGHSISPVDVERVLLTHPNVAECGCVGAPDPQAQRSSIVKAFIVLKDASPEDSLKRSIQDYFKRHGPPYMYPRDIVFVESLPKTVNGKISRSQLRQLV